MRGGQQRWRRALGCRWLRLAVRPASLAGLWLAFERRAGFVPPGCTAAPRANAAGPTRKINCNPAATGAKSAHELTSKQRNPRARMRKTREYAAKRVFSMRSDASVWRAQTEIERVFGLPAGSVVLILPRGRRARSDKSIGALIEDWNRS